MTAVRPDFAIQTEDAYERIVAIVDAMVAGRWVRGQTAGEIAERFGVKTTAVSREAVVVGKVVDYVLSDRAQLEARLRARYEDLHAKARDVHGFALEEQPIVNREGEVIGTRRDLSAANGALREARGTLDSIARNAGIGNKPDTHTNVQVNIGTGDSDLAAMLLNLSPDELAVVARDDVWSALQRQVKAFRRGTVETEGEER